MSASTTKQHPTTSTSTPFSIFSNFYSLGLLRILSIFSCLITSTNGFTFRFSSAPAQCESTSVTWSDGTPPYKILLLPIGFQPQGVETRVIYEKTISSSNQFAFNFPFPASSKFVAVMSDATGFGSGGTSPILTVQSSNTSSCLPTTPSTPEFYLYLSSSTLSQCQTVHISWDNPSNPPITVYGVIPQGESFDLNAASHANGGNGFDWTVNVPSGTPFFFVAGDGNGSGKGGSTDVQYVGGGSSGCLGSDPPTTTSDGSVGGVGSLPSTGTLTTTVTQTSGSSNGNNSDGSGSGNGDQNGDGNNGNDNGNNGNGDGSGNGNGGGNSDPGSGGGTVHGPEPTTIATDSGRNQSSKARLTVALVISLLGLAALIGLGFLFWKRHQRHKERRDNQKARLLLADDMSELNATHDLPHPRPTFASRTWAGGSLESLTNGLRATPFIWPIRSGSRTPSTSPLERVREREARDEGYMGDTSTPADIGAVGTSSARPPLPDHSTSSGLLRRLRSVRYAGSGFGFPFGSGTQSGYRSLGDEDDSTPSSQPTHTMNNSGSGTSGLDVAGHRTTDSNQSGEIHKSPLPLNYTRHSSNPSHGSALSHNSHRPTSPRSGESDAITENDHVDPQMLGIQSTSLARPGPAPAGPRPLPPPSRPSMGRADTGGSIWEVPPTYASLQRLLKREG